MSVTFPVGSINVRRRALDPYESSWGLVCKLAGWNAAGLNQIGALLCAKRRNLGDSGADFLTGAPFELDRIERLTGMPLGYFRLPFVGQAVSQLLGPALGRLPCTTAVMRKCPKCHRKGQHFSIFQIEHLTECPVHRCPLEPVLDDAGRPLLMAWKSLGDVQMRDTHPGWLRPLIEPWSVAPSKRIAALTEELVEAGRRRTLALANSQLIESGRVDRPGSDLVAALLAQRVEVWTSRDFGAFFAADRALLQSCSVKVRALARGRGPPFGDLCQAVVQLVAEPSRQALSFDWAHLDAVNSLWRSIAKQFVDAFNANHPGCLDLQRSLAPHALLGDPCEACPDSRAMLHWSTWAQRKHLDALVSLALMPFIDGLERFLSRLADRAWSAALWFLEQVFRTLLHSAFAEVLTAQARGRRWVESWDGNVVYLDAEDRLAVGPLSPSWSLRLDEHMDELRLNLVTAGSARVESVGPGHLERLRKELTPNGASQ